jgi:hypothetical protein
MRPAARAEAFRWRAVHLEIGIYTHSRAPFFQIQI